MRPDEAAIHDVFTPAMSIGVVDVSDTTACSQLLVVATEWCRRHVAKKHNRVFTGREQTNTQQTNTTVQNITFTASKLRPYCTTEMCILVIMISFAKTYTDDDNNNNNYRIK